MSRYFSITLIRIYCDKQTKPPTLRYYQHQIYTDKNSIMPNRLINSTSPYLQQHAQNPVDWFPWGEEALQKARNENKLLLISIGYSACHWCHVME
ncbi:MAG: DUF255 domain-containing protein, partial [Janthinobacterium lividum]